MYWGLRVLCRIEVAKIDKENEMKEKIKEYIEDMTTYIFMGVWLGAGCAVGFWAVTVMYLGH